MTEIGEKWGRVTTLSQKVCSKKKKEKKRKEHSSRDIQSAREVVKPYKIRKRQGNVKSSVRFVLKDTGELSKKFTDGCLLSVNSAGRIERYKIDWNITRRLSRRKYEMTKIKILRRLLWMLGLWDFRLNIRKVQMDNYVPLNSSNPCLCLTQHVTVNAKL